MSADKANANVSMPYVRLGSSGLKVSRIILGCLSYGSREYQSWILPEEEGITEIKQAYDLGINAFDTSNTYSNGKSEEILGKAIRQHNIPREEIVVLTKVFFPVGRDNTNLISEAHERLDRERYVNQYGLSRKHIFDSVKASLKRLQLDYIDVLQCHRFDYNTPIEETMQALHDVVQAGFVRYIGMSSCYAWQFHKMQAYAKANNLTQFISMQNFYNAIYREEEREMIPLLQDMGVGMIPWSPLARGFLTRPIPKEGDEANVRAASDQFFRCAGDPEKERWLGVINERIAGIAQTRGVSMAQVALAWVLSKPFVTAPIVGTTSIDKLKDLVAGVHLTLTKDELKAIDEPYRPRTIEGHS